MIASTRRYFKTLVIHKKLLKSFLIRNMSIVNQMFNITDSNIQNVRKFFGKSEDDIKEDLKTLNEWMKKNQHLPKIQDDTRLERILLRNKYRIEQTKTKLENYFTMHGKHPTFFDEIKNNFDGIVKASAQYKICVAPHLNENHERVIYCRIFSKDKPLDWKNIFCSAFIMMELQLMHDYSVGERYIVDGSNITMSHYKSMCTEINMLIKAFSLHQEGYSGRIMGFEFINAPSYFDMFLNVFKILFKPKLVSKVRVHISLEDLYKVVDQKYLPSDIGGYLKEAQYYQDISEKAATSERDNILRNIGETSNEALRLKKSIEKMNRRRTLFGVDGTFKKLNID